MAVHQSPEERTSLVFGFVQNKQSKNSDIHLNVKEEMTKS